MTKFFNKLKKPCFLPIFGPFSQFLGQKHFFPENLAVMHRTNDKIAMPGQMEE